jgi:hypothetical protein
MSSVSQRETPDGLMGPGSTTAKPATSGPPCGSRDFSQGRAGLEAWDLHDFYAALGHVVWLRAGLVSVSIVNDQCVHTGECGPRVGTRGPPCGCSRCRRCHARCHRGQRRRRMRHRCCTLTMTLDSQRPCRARTGVGTTYGSYVPGGSCVLTARVSSTCAG